MTAVDNESLERCRRAILAHEGAIAETLARRIVERPSLSVWMILVPLLLVHYLQRHRVYRHAVRHVTEALLRTRRRALDLACAELCGVEPIEVDALSSQSDDLRALHAAEEAEVVLLAHHYARLLLAEGDDYTALVRHAYGSAGAYRETLDALQVVERRMNTAALDAKRGERPPELFEQLENARSEARVREVELVFG